MLNLEEIGLDVRWGPSPHRSGGTARRPDLPNRSTGHTTETGTGTIDAVARNLVWPYHLLLDPVTRDARQLLDAEKTAYSLKSYAAASWSYRRKWEAFETNHAGAHHFQWSIIGFASQMHLLTDGDLEWLGSIIGPTLRALDIPLNFDATYGAGEGIVLAREDSIVRMTPGPWYDFNGVTWHQLAPAQDHWDPGKLDYRKLETYSRSAGMLPLTEQYKIIPSIRSGNYVLDGEASHPTVELWQRMLVATGTIPELILGGSTPFVDGVDGPRTRAANTAWETSRFGVDKANGKPGKFAWPLLLNISIRECEQAPISGPSLGELAALQASLNECELRAATLAESNQALEASLDASQAISLGRRQAMDSAELALDVP